MAKCFLCGDSVMEGMEEVEESGDCLVHGRCIGTRWETALGVAWRRIETLEKHLQGLHEFAERTAKTAAALDAELHPILGSRLEALEKQARTEQPVAVAPERAKALAILDAAGEVVKAASSAFDAWDPDWRTPPEFDAQMKALGDSLRCFYAFDKAP